jgi:hypothetical protein
MICLRGRRVVRDRFGRCNPMSAGSYRSDVTAPALTLPFRSRRPASRATAAAWSGCVRGGAAALALAAGLLLDATGVSAIGQTRPLVPALAPREEVCRVYRDAGVYAMELSNGVRLVVRPMKPDDRGGTVHIVARVVGGVMHECGNSAGMSELAAQAWTPPAASPTDSPRPDARGRTQGSQGRISAVAAPEGLMLRAQVPSTDVPATLEAMGRMLASPTVDAERFERARSRALASARAILADDVAEPQDTPPSTRPWSSSARGDRMMLRAMVALRDLMDGGIVEPSVEALAQANPESTRDWLAHIVNASGVEVTIVGDVSPGRALELTRGALGELRCGEWAEASTLRQSAIDAAARKLRSPPELAEGDDALPTLRIERVLPRGVPGRMVVIGPGPCMGDIASVRAWAVASRIVQSRLRATGAVGGAGEDSAAQAVLRSARAEAMPRRLVGSASGLMVTMDLRNEGDGPKMSDERLRALAVDVWAEIDRVLAGDVTDDEVRAVGQALAADARRRMGDAGYWASVLSMASAYGLSPDRLASAEREYAEMNARRLAETFRKRREAIAASGLGALLEHGERRGLALLPTVEPQADGPPDDATVAPARTEGERDTGSARP